MHKVKALKESPPKPFDAFDSISFKFIIIGENYLKNINEGIHLQLNCSMESKRCADNANTINSSNQMHYPNIAIRLFYTATV